MSIFKKKRPKSSQLKSIQNVKYQNINIKTKKHKFSKIEVDPFALDVERDQRPIFIQLKEYLYYVVKEIFKIRWQPRRETFTDFKIIFWIILFLGIFFFVVQIIITLISGQKIF